MTMTGQQVGRFIIGNHVGEGRYAMVREAYPIGEDTKLVIKIQNKELIASVNPKFIKSELETYKKIKDMEGIPKFIEFIEDDENAYFVTEFINGYHLQRELIERDTLKKGAPLSLEEKKDILLQTIKIIRSLHKIGVYHGDLKLENVLVSHGKVYVIDFGCSIISNNPNKILRTEILGTPGFAPPEISPNNKRIAMPLEIIDVWGLCNIFFYMFTNKYPFGNENVGLTYKKVQTCSYTTENIPKSVIQICEKVFNKNREKRISLDAFEKLIMKFEL